MMAALASAAMPNATIAGTRDSEQVNATDKGYGIDHAVVQDAAGKLYDTFASNTPKGRKRLAGRVRAAQTLMGNRELGGLGFDVDRVLAFSNGEQERSVTGDVSVMIATHHDGQARPLTLLTLDDCASVGTAFQLYRNVMKAIKGEEDQLVTQPQLMRVMRLMEAMTLSAQRNETVHSRI